MKNNKMYEVMLCLNGRRRHIFMYAVEF